MTDDLRSILDRVASGELSPEDAQNLMSAAPIPAEAPEQDPSADQSAAQDQPSSDTHAEGSVADEETTNTGSTETVSSSPLDADEPANAPVTSIVVRSSGVRLSILADPSVATAVADGPHRVEQQGSRLIIHSDLSQSGYTTDAPRSAFKNWVSTVTRAGLNLRIRVNPELPLEVLTIAGSLDLSGLHAPAAIGIEAGSAKLTGGSGPLVLSVSTGSAEVEWQFTGVSTITTEVGSTKVTVLPGSDAVVSAEVTLGSAQIRTAEAILKASAAEGPASTTVGNGTGKLSVIAKLGSADVHIA